MSLLSHIGSFAQPSSTGTQAITGLGFQPKVVLLWMSHMTSDGVTVNRHLSYGCFTDTTHRWYHDTGGVPDNVTNYVTANQAQRAQDTKCIGVMTGPGNAVAVAEADISSVDSDGFTLDWTTVDATARIVCYLALGGTDITNATTGEITNAAAATGNQAFTGVGFQPDFVFFSHNRNSNPPFANNGSFSRYGWGVGGGASNAAAGCAEFANSANTSGGTQRSAGIALHHESVAGVVAFSASFTSFDSDGFTLNFATAGTSMFATYLAIKGLRATCGVFNTPTSTGTLEIGGLPSEPVAVLLLSGGHPASTTVTAAARNSFGAMTGAGGQFCAATSCTSGSSNVRTNNRLIRTKAMTVLAAAASPTTVVEAGFSAVSANSFTLDWTTVDAAAREIVYVALGPIPPPPPPSNLKRLSLLGVG